MPGIGDEIDGAVQQAPQSGRQAMLCALMPCPRQSMYFLQTSATCGNADLTEGQILPAIAAHPTSSSAHVFRQNKALNETSTKTRTYNSGQDEAEQDEGYSIEL